VSAHCSEKETKRKRLYGKVATSAYSCDLRGVVVAFAGYVDRPSNRLSETLNSIPTSLIDFH
jgi:hypothetical protein